MDKVKRFKVGDQCILFDHTDRSWHGTTVTIIQVYPDDFMTDYEVSRKLPEGNTAYPERSCMDSQLIDITKKEDNMPVIDAVNKYPSSDIAGLISAARSKYVANKQKIKDLAAAKLRTYTTGTNLTKDQQENLRYLDASIYALGKECDDITSTINLLESLT